MNKARYLLLLKLLPLFLFLIFFAWYVLFKVLVITGKYEVSFIPGEKTKFVESFAPEEQPQLRGDNFFVMSQDWNSFTAKVPRINFDNIEFELKYKNLDQQSEFLAGVLQKDGLYQEKALEMFNPIFENLDPTQWKKIEENNLILWQRYKEDQSVQYSNIQDFLTNLPSISKILTYNYNLFAPVRFHDSTSTAGIEFNTPLRGSHQFYTYLEDGEELNFTFLTQDTNFLVQQRGDVGIKITKNEEKIYEEIFKEDKNTKFPGKPDPEKEISLKLPDLKKGVYTINFEASDNIIIKKIKTTQKWLVFSGIKLYLEPQDKETVLFMFGGSYLNIQSPSKAGLQTIRIDNENVEIKKAKKKYSIEYLNGTLDQPVQIVVPRGGLILDSNGFFSFSLNNTFQPYELITKWNGQLSEQEINLQNFEYLIAQYIYPQEDNGWLYAKINFDAKSIDTSSGIVWFRLNAPYLRKGSKEIYLSEMKITFTRQPLDFSYLWERILTIRENFKNKIWKLGK